MSTPPDQPDQHKAKKPIEKQLDELLIQIEEAEPGVIDPGVLPASYNIKSKATPTNQAAPSPEPAPAPTEKTAETTPEQADMLAALNAALQDMSSDAPDDEAGEPEAPAPTEPASELSMEEKLQQEIAALMNSEPQADTSASTESADELEGSFETPEQISATATDNAPSTEDQIATEIEGLLNAGQESTANDQNADKESAIDELDNMLASEIDADDDLAGDFQTVEDVTAGIQVPSSNQPTLDDEHAATARDVAAELDSQPEDLPAPPPRAAAVEQPAEDPFAVLSEIADTAQKNEVEHKRQVLLSMPKWQRWLATAKDRLFAACYVINWPARRLSAEWRANIGYIALLNLFFGVGLWIVLIVF